MLIIRKIIDLQRKKRKRKRANPEVGLDHVIVTDIIDITVIDIIRIDNEIEANLCQIVEANNLQSEHEAVVLVISSVFLQTNEEKYLINPFYIYLS